MTTATKVPTLDERLTEVAERLDAEGWDVRVRPSPADLPERLEGLRPDLVAGRRDETVVVDVVSHGKPPGPRTIALAEAVAALPGWRFNIVCIAEEPALAEQGVLAARATRARSLVDVDLEAAFLLAWSSLEGVLRRLGDPRGLADDATGELLAGLASLGVLDHEEHERARRAWRHRRALIHGREAPEVTADEVTGLVDLVHVLSQGRRED